MRARYPDVEDVVVRDGVRIGYELYDPPEGSDDATTILLPTSMPLVHARQWKAQVPFLARHFRVLLVEGRGNGRADRPSGVAAHALDQDVDDLLAALDATGTARAVAVGFSGGARRALALTAAHPHRVTGVVAIAPAMFPRSPAPDPDRPGRDRFDPDAIRADFAGFIDYFFSTVLTDPHSTQPLDDALAWAQGCNADTLLDFFAAWSEWTPERAREICAAVRCPVLVIQGTADLRVPCEDGAAVAELTGGSLVTLPGAGHALGMREPVRVNLLIRDFARTVTGARPCAMSWTPARHRTRRALFLSSSIGLGHARRDLAIANALRALRPDVEIEWLTQHPVTALLEVAGERVHPASRWLASESGHIEGECGEHDLHAFQAVRTMDEILVANFHVLDDVTDTEHVDLIVGDEAWDLDHFLHENPERKRAPYVWLTDFVGWLPMPDGGPREAELTADYNTQMIEQINRYPQLRDAALFVGEPDDLVTHSLGPGLPTVRDWTLEHYAFPGYITGFSPVDREAVRAELGWKPAEPICLVSAGGSGVGTPLLRRVAEAHPYAAKRVPGLRTVVVTGPRIDPAAVPAAAGVEVHGFVPGLHRLLAACDVAVVQGGLTTTMELTALRRPFLYFPLRRHFEQQIHVAHRLDRHRAGTRMDYATATPESIGDALASELTRPVVHRPVPADGARRAAALIAELI
jgi:pimeloyl-ACP methyl ester carboxylesterase/predicted glycosyltransferase